MKSFFRHVFVFLASIFVLLTTSCNANVSFKINFIVDNSVYSVVETSGKEIITMPQNPSKENYTFEGWYWDKDIWKNEFTARSLLDTPLSSNMEVYAHFIDESYLLGTEIRVKNSEKVNIEGIGYVFYVNVKNNQMVFKFNDYVESNPLSNWSLSSDITGNNVITSKMVELVLGNNPLYYIYVTDKNGQHESYIVLIHRNYMFTVTFDSRGGSYCDEQKVEEGSYLANVPIPTRNGYTFEGWDYDFENQPIKNNIVAKAVWSNNEYKISYEPNGGFVDYNVQSVTYGQQYELLTPTRKGYTFNGWLYKNTYFNTSGTWTITQDIILVADWDINYYSIDYFLNGGSFKSNEAVKSYYTVEESFYVPSPYRKGYTFNGWSLSTSLTNPIVNYQVKKGTTGYIQLYASWKANHYTVTFDTDGGTIEKNNQEVVYGEHTTLPNPNKEGYTFNGWKNGSDSVSSGNWNIDNNVTLTASWSAIKYPIRYELNGGINDSKNPSTYTIESKDITLYGPERKGYTFLGWSTLDNDQPELVMTIQQGSFGEKYFIANWEANTYSITLNVNGGDELSKDEILCVYDAETILPIPTKAGYSFSGWYYGTQLITSGTWKIDEDLMLVAKWIRDVYSIIYQMNGGNNNAGNPLYYNYDDETITLKDATRTGYTFLGWSTLDNDLPVKNIQIEHNSVGEKYFIANWEANTYSVTFNVNGGKDIEETTQTIAFDEILTLPKTSRDGYSFTGWYYGNTLIESGKYQIPKDIVLIAKWEPNSYTITKENGSGAGSTTVSYGSKYNLGVSNKTGYEFTGWYSDDYGSGTKYTDENGYSINKYEDLNDITLYAGFIYYLNFESNGGTAVPSIVLHENETLDESICPSKEGKTFAGWYLDEKLTIEAPNDVAIGNATLYAKWEEEISPEYLSYEKSNGIITITGSTFDGLTMNLPTHIGGCEIQNIFGSAFANHSYLKTVVIPNNIQTIGNKAFNDCNSLKNITLPFVGSTRITRPATNYHVGSGNERRTGYVFGYLFDYTYSMSMPSKICTSEGYTYQTHYAEGGYTGPLYYYYYKFKIPQSIRSVRITDQDFVYYDAFRNCDLIEEIQYDKELILIENSFLNCKSLKRFNSSIDGQIMLGNCVEYISGAFSNCNQIKMVNTNEDGKVIIPYSTKYICDYSFKGMSLINTVYLPNNNISVSRDAFDSSISRIVY